MKIYTLDEKLLVERPEVRIGDKLYPMDDRQKTVSKILELQKGVDKDPDKEDFTAMEQLVFELVFGSANAKEIDEMNLPFAAYQQLFEIVMAAVTGEDPAQVQRRFQKPQEEQQEMV